MLLSCAEQESNQRSRHRGGARCFAKCALPYEPLPQLRIKMVRKNDGENVPIFALPCCVLHDLPKCATGDPRVFGARERDSQRINSRLLFVLFLPKQEKYINLLNNNLPPQKRYRAGRSGKDYRSKSVRMIRRHCRLNYNLPCQLDVDKSVLFGV